MALEVLLIVMNRINKNSMIIIKMVTARLGINIMTLIVLYGGGTEVQSPTTSSPSAVWKLTGRRATTSRGVAVRWPPASMFNLRNSIDTFDKIHDILNELQIRKELNEK